MEWTRLLSGLALAYFLLWAWTHKHNQPAEPITSRVWRPSHQDFVYPELEARYGLKDHLESRDDFGIAFAGGGTRGMGFSHGVARALWNAGILQRARYASVTSGSTWFGIPFYYQHVDSIDEFLGESLGPEKLSPEVLVSQSSGTMVTRLEFPVMEYPFIWKKEEAPDDNSRRLKASLGSEDSPEEQHPSMIHRLIRCMRDPCACAAVTLIPNTSLEEMWQLAVGAVFLRPFGLTSRDAVYAQPSEVTRMRSMLGSNTTIYPTRDITKDKLPFLVSQSAVFALMTGRNVTTNPLVVFPYEQTPIYAGTVQGYTGASAGGYGGFGDVLVEPFATRSEIIEVLPDQASAPLKIKQRRVFRNLGGLADWVGIATAFISDFQQSPHWWTRFTHGKSFCPLAIVEKFLPHVQMWTPLFTNPLNKVPVTQMFPVGDAGLYDDLGHLPLLRRKVSKMVIFDTSAIHDKVSNGTSDLLQMTYTLAAFGQPNAHFGSLPGASNPNQPKDFMTVFEPSEFGKLWNEVKRLKEANEPVIVRGNFTTVENHHFGIVGGRRVEVVWVIGMHVAEWRDALPSATSKKLPSYFPNYQCWQASTKFQIGALSQFGSWLTERALNEINAMLAVAKPSANRDQQVVI